jgi:DNA-binding winged helix-turn-helix (wHTH) protein
MSTQLTPIVRQERDTGVCEVPGFPARYVRFGNFQIDLQREELYQEGQRIKMQAQLYRALLLLVSRAGEIISRQEVRKWLWPEVFLANLDANVNTTMNKLRQVLGDAPDKPRYIETLPRRGYTFIAAVEYSEQPEAKQATRTAGTASEARVPSALPKGITHSFRSLLRVAGFLLAGMLVGALLTFVWFFAQAKNHRNIDSGKAAAALATPGVGKIRA